jgi:hypothetical protein
MPLIAAHRGYEYQDLLVACRFVDMLLGNVIHANVDKKLVADDRFDDLTTIDAIGNRERIQFKHTDNDDRPLSLRTFTTEDRKLRLDRLIECMFLDRDGPGRDAHELTFRIILRDQAPQDQALKYFLKKVTSDPGPFLPGVGTLRLAFDPEALWNQRNKPTEESSNSPFAFLFANNPSITYDDLKWVCTHLIVEVGAPPSSVDLTAPDSAEILLLTRVRDEVGAEAFPNADRSSIDVAAALISAARAARQDRLEPTAQELLRRAQLRSDFGSVSRAYPVNSTFEVLRPTAVSELIEEANELAKTGGCLIVEGPPGHGKSWVSQQFLDALSGEGWLTAEHYCYLGDADAEQTERVLAETVFGSLVSRLADADPKLVEQQRPRFAADEAALVECLKQSIRHKPDRRVALIIDGIDHVTRVRARNGVEFDPSRSLAESLSLFELPAGVVVIILSQPGSHLQPLRDEGAKTVNLPGLGYHEIKLLAERLNVIPDNEHQRSIKWTPLIDDAEAVEEFLTALNERSKGNALYATYLCREMLRQGEALTDFANAVLNLPPFDGTLKNYYEHLYEALGDTADWVAEVIALVDFAVTRVELREIEPTRSRHVDKALKVLEPVLVERATQGGIRIYHESFARYLRNKFKDDPSAVKALLSSIANWLGRKGLLNDSRAFRSLPKIFSQTENDDQVLALINKSFVVDAVAAGFPSSAILSNLATAIRSAARLGDWPAIVRYVEMSRGVHSFQRERFDSLLVSFADVPASLLGSDILAARLVDDDHLTMQAREGLQMCAAVDALGATAPWRAYMLGYLREKENDNTSYGEASDHAVELAWLRGRLRLSAINSHSELENHTTSNEAETQQRNSEDVETELNLEAPINWCKLAGWVEDTNLQVSQVLNAIDDTYGWDGITRFIKELEHPGKAYLVLAEKLSNKPGFVLEVGSPRLWGYAAFAHGLPSGWIHRLLKLGIDPIDIAGDTVTYTRQQLLNLTIQVQESSIQFETGAIGAWLDACALAAHLDPFGLNTAEALIVDEGWYRCWLRFVLALMRAEAADSTNCGSFVLEALQLLKDDLNPFSGDPRSCDLYRLQSTIADTLRRAVNRLDDEQWEKGLTLLNEVSTSITTTLFGELGGPVPPDLLLQIAVEGATPTRHKVAKVLLEDKIEQDSGDRYYADLAEYRLLAARLALADDDRAQAQVLWQEACLFLTAYGSHKDATIYEVLEPLPMLIKKEPARARCCVAAVQGLCERVPLHTDGKGTRGAWSRWWKLLAKADPVATIHLAVPQLLSECNDSNALLNGALENVWQEWYEKVDPFFSGVLRLTLDIPLHQADIGQLQRLASDSSAGSPIYRQLMTWLLARIDERPVSYSYSNRDELIAKDDDEVAKINEIAANTDLPQVFAIRDDSTVASKYAQDQEISLKPMSSRANTLDDLAVVTFPEGLSGLTRAIRMWHRKPYDSQSPQWNQERFANIIGYRLIDLTVEGRHEEAVLALQLLAEDSGLRDRSSILRSIAEGLERHSEFRLAAVAYTLTWTRTCGGGGWLSFGGETEIDALQRATALDPKIACEIVAEEIERAISTSRYEIYGISQAIIYAFSVGAMVCPDKKSLDVAFMSWDEAFTVIEKRAPHVHPSDAPDLVYQPLDQDSREPAPGDIEAAMALAALGGLAHPSREKKRRAFLAAQLLLNERPQEVSPAFVIALSTISDPTTLTWLLRLMEISSANSLPILMACQNTLRDLVSRDRLTVRALARRLIRGDQPPLVPPSPARSALLSEQSKPIWLPEGIGNSNSAELIHNKRFIEVVAQLRLSNGERFLPGLLDAVAEQVAEIRVSEAFKKRLKSQLDAFADSVRKRWPNAFLASIEVIEDALQSIAASGRTARLMTGTLISNPVEWEDQLASAILNDITIPLLVETHRQPRPQISPPPGMGNKVWVQVHESRSNASSLSIVEAAEEDERLLSTITVKSASCSPVVEGGKFEGWRWFATVENRFVKHPDWRSETDLSAERYCALEIRNANDRQALTRPPVATGDMRQWNIGIEHVLETPLLERSQPLVGMDDELGMVGDGRQGLGVPNPLLAPTVSLIALLKLHPGAPFSYEDENGLALTLSIWRAEYDISDYYLARPQIWGCGIVIRPDLFNQLVTTVGEERLVLRDFIMGDLKLLSHSE